MSDELYTLSSEARADLANIYRFGYERFGEAQADSYLVDLLERLCFLGLHPSSAPIIDELHRQPRRAVFRSHVIFFDSIPTGPIVVRRILGAQDTMTAF